MAFGAHIATRAETQMRLMRQTEAKLMANLLTNKALMEVWQAQLDRAKRSLKVNQMLFMRFCRIS